MILYVFEVLEEFNGLVPSMASDPALKDQVMFSDGEWQGLTGGGDMGNILKTRGSLRLCQYRDGGKLK